MGIMNAVEERPVHESLSHKLSAIRTMGDIFYAYSHGDRTVTLDFRPMAGIKFTAVALLEDTSSTETVTDVNRAIELFVSALKLNYAHGILHTSVFDTWFLEVQLNSSIWTVGSFMQELRSWLMLAEVTLAPTP